MKKTLAKVLALALCAVLLVTGTVFVTLAYLQAESGVVRNTFSSAGITITLDEAKVDKDGNRLDKNDAIYTGAEGQELADRVMVQAQDYFLIPGSTYTKDPTVHVQAGSLPCYVFIAVRNTMFVANDVMTEGINENVEATDYSTIAAQMSANGWVELPGYMITNEEVKTVLGLNKLENRTDEDWNEGEYTLYYYLESDTNVEDGKVDGAIDAATNTIDLEIFENFKVSSNASVLDTKGKHIDIIAFAVQAQGIMGTAGREDFGDAAKHALVNSYAKQGPFDE